MISSGTARNENNREWISALRSRGIHVLVVLFVIWCLSSLMIVVGFMYIAYMFDGILVHGIVSMTVCVYGCMVT